MTRGLCWLGSCCSPGAGHFLRGAPPPQTRFLPLRCWCACRGCRCVGPKLLFWAETQVRVVGKRPLCGQLSRVGSRPPILGPGPPRGPISVPTAGPNRFSLQCRVPCVAASASWHHSLAPAQGLCMGAHAAPRIRDHPVCTPALHLPPLLHVPQSGLLLISPAAHLPSCWWQL